MNTPPDPPTRPPHPERRQPLPGWHPKSPHDDPGAEEAIRRIRGGSSYRAADEDLGFLQEDETRGLRLQLEYLKAETLLRQHDIANPIVVFGSTRIDERPASERRLAAINRQLALTPDDIALRSRHVVAERLLAKSRYYETARELGRIVGRAGLGGTNGRTVIMTGGGPGIMEAANRGASEVGAPSIGFNVTLPHEQFPNPYITPALCLQFRYFAIRKFHFALRAKALVVFPGGFGTLDELFEILELSQTRKMPPVPVILVGEDYWRRAFDADFLVEEGVIDPEDRELFWFAESAESIWSGILRWHDIQGTPLLGLKDGPA